MPVLLSLSCSPASVPSCAGSLGGEQRLAAASALAQQGSLVGPGAIFSPAAVPSPPHCCCCFSPSPFCPPLPTAPTTGLYWPPCHPHSPWAGGHTGSGLGLALHRGNKPVPAAPAKEAQTGGTEKGTEDLKPFHGTQGLGLAHFSLATLVLATRGRRQHVLATQLALGQMPRGAQHNNMMPRQHLLGWGITVARARQGHSSTGSPQDPLQIHSAAGGR